MECGEDAMTLNADKGQTGGGGIAVSSGLVRNGRGGRFVSLVSADTLTEQQRRFVEAFVRNGGNAQAAGESAGYGRSSCYSVSRLPQVREAIQQTLDHALRTEGAALAWGCVRQMLTDAATPANVRLQAARWTLEHSGLGLASQQARLGLPISGQPLAEMDEQALAAFVQAGRAALATLVQTEADTPALPACLPDAGVPPA